MKNAKAFILSSLWEDPGFVIIEAAFCRTVVFSSNCITGPREIIKNNYNGYLFESNNIKSFVDNFEKIIDKNNSTVLLNNLRYTKNFSLFNHYNTFKNFLSVN